MAWSLLLAVVAKSAQAPLSSWLPDAMVAPTPVSALLHSATMVAAGVFLLLQLYPVFEAAPGLLDTAAAVGGATALLGAFLAAGARDLKRVLAWSTVAHRGEMVLAVGLRAPSVAALLLLVHALYKSALFLPAGVVSRRRGTTELDALGGLARTMPVTSAAFFVAALTLAGVPPPRSD